MITELDVSDKWLPSDVALRDQLVARTYRRFLDVTLAFPAVKGVLSWGLRSVLARNELVWAVLVAMAVFVAKWVRARHA